MLNPSARKRLKRVALFNADIGSALFICIGNTGDIVRYTEVICQQCNLKGADFVCNMPVSRDGICRRGEKVDPFLLHTVGNHIVGNNSCIEPHIGGTACSEAGSL